MGVLPLSIATMYSDRLQQRLQSATNLIYYPFEDIALAGGIAPKLLPVDEAWWWAKSDWAWVGAQHVARSAIHNPLAPFVFSRGICLSSMLWHPCDSESLCV